MGPDGSWKQRERASLLQMLLKLMLTYGKGGTKWFPSNNQWVGRNMGGWVLGQERVVLGSEHGQPTYTYTIKSYFFPNSILPHYLFKIDLGIHGIIGLDLSESKVPGFNTTLCNLLASNFYRVIGAKVETCTCAGCGLFPVWFPSLATSPTVVLWASPQVERLARPQHLHC
jgi:hypothetical protein